MCTHTHTVYLAVKDCAVIGAKDIKWGEVPCAFIEKKNSKLSEEDIIKTIHDSIININGELNKAFDDLFDENRRSIRGMCLYEIAKLKRDYDKEIENIYGKIYCISIDFATKSDCEEIKLSLISEISFLLVVFVWNILLVLLNGCETPLIFLPLVKERKMVYI